MKWLEEGKNKMGSISYTTSSIIFIVLLIGLIAIFPANLCLPFTDICLFLEPLYYLKNTLTYVITIVIAIFLLALIPISLISFVRFVKNNEIIKNVILFLLTYEEKHWNKIRKSI